MFPSDLSLHLPSLTTLLFNAKASPLSSCVDVVRAIAAASPALAEVEFRVAGSHEDARRQLSELLAALVQRGASTVKVFAVGAAALRDDMPQDLTRWGWLRVTLNG